MTKNTAKIPPQAIEIEKSVIGAMLIDKRAIYTVTDLIKTPEVFYLPEHQKIFIAIVSLDKAAKPIDIFTVSETLRQSGKLQEVGGEYYLITLSNIVATGAHSEFHSRILLQYYLKRKLIDLGRFITLQGYDDRIDAFDLQTAVENKLTEITNIIQQGAPAQMLSDYMEKLTDRLKMLDKLQPGELLGLPTGFEGLDRLTGGYSDGHLIIIAARPGMGKTSYMLKKASAMAKTGKAVGIFSVEMPALELAARLSTINSHFHLKQIMQTGFEKTEYWQKWYSLRDELSGYNIVLDDYSQLTISELRRRAIAMKRQHNVSAIFVDYIQLMKEEGKGNREQEISRISGGLKSLAKELNIPVIALAQLSRKVEERNDKRPKLSDLRESGAIEQDADMVQMLYRPDYYNKEMDDENLLDKYPGANTEVIINKNRHGSIGKIGIYFDANKVKFMDVAELNKELTPETNPF